MFYSIGLKQGSLPRFKVKVTTLFFWVFGIDGADTGFYQVLVL